MNKIIYTIGHSTRSIEEFIELLKTYEIMMLVDIRTIPKSRFNPQFNKEILEKSLNDAGIKYHHLQKLGGLRRANKDSINTGWRNLAFRGFADYMQTNLFKEGVEELEIIAKEYKTTLMCAEAEPWRCHRSLVSDALTKHKWKVFHILSKTNARPHKFTSFLHMKKKQFIYSDEPSKPSA